MQESKEEQNFTPKDTTDEDSPTKMAEKPNVLDEESSTKVLENPNTSDEENSKTVAEKPRTNNVSLMLLLLLSKILYNFVKLIIRNCTKMKQPIYFSTSYLSRATCHTMKD